MKIIQILEAHPSLQKFAAQDLSIKTLYKVSKLLRKLDEELAFYNEQRNKILAQYCDIVENRYVPRENDVQKLNDEIQELTNVEIDCEINEVVIGCDEDIKLSYNDLIALEGFVRIEGED